MTGSKESLQFNKFEIFSNEGSGSVDLRSGTPRIEYRENVFTPYINITAAIVDTGNAFSANDGSGRTISLLESIKCQGTEKILFNIEDGRGNKIKLDKDSDLRVDSTSFVTESFKSTSFILNIVSKEAYDNTLLDNRCRINYSGKISDIAQTIIKKTLKSNKKIDADKFKNDYDILSVLRNLKIIGIFMRLAERDKKRKYLKLIPYAWKMIDNRIGKNKDLVNLKLLLETNFPKFITK